MDEEFDPNAYGAEDTPAPVVNLFDPAAYASGKEAKPVEQPPALPTITPRKQTYYYPSTPEDTRAKGLSYSMEGGIHGAGKFSDLDLRNHTLEQYKDGKSPFVAVAMAGVPTGAEFMTPLNGELVHAKQVDTGGGLIPGQVDVATSNPDLARGGGSFNPKAYADGKPGVPDIHAFMEPAPADTPEAEAKDEPTPAEIVGGAISKAASKYGAALRDIPKLEFTKPEFQPPAIPQVPQQQQQVIPQQGMIGAAIPTAQPLPSPVPTPELTGPGFHNFAPSRIASDIGGEVKGMVNAPIELAHQAMDPKLSIPARLAATIGVVASAAQLDPLLPRGGVSSKAAITSTREVPVPEAMQPKGATSENVPTNRPEPQLPEPQQFSVDMPGDTFGTEHTPIANFLMSGDGVMSKSTAKRNGLYAKNPALWENAPKLAHPTHGKLYGSTKVAILDKSGAPTGKFRSIGAGGQTPDLAASALYDKGLIPDAYPDTMWEALGRESQSARNTLEAERGDAKAIGQASKVKAGQTKAFNAAERAAWKGGEPAIPVKDLQVGDTVTVGGEKFKVTDIDPDTFDVTLEDGSKYGVQSVSDNTVIYGKHEGTGAPKPKVAATPAPRPSPVATPPPRQPPPPPRQPPQGPPPQNPPPGGGIPPQPPKTVPEVLRNRVIKDRIAAGKDSVFTRADYDARQKANGVRQDFGAQTTRSPNLKENVQANKDMEAATFIAEAQGNKIALAHDLEMVRNSKNAKLAKKYEPILKYAMDNFTRISDQLSKSRYMKLMSDQFAEDVASGITYPEREGYVTHVLKNEPENAFVSFFTGKQGSGGLSRYFTKSREYGTLAEAINDGIDPASVNLADLAQHRIASSRRLILNKALFNELKNVQDQAGNPVLKGVFRLPDPPHAPVVPKGYELMNLNGIEVAVHPGYSGLFKSLYGDSALRRTAAGRTVMKAAGISKSYTLAADTYHGFRGIQKGFFYGGKGSRLGYKRGVTVYELSNEGLDTAVKNGEISQSQADWAKSARPAVEEMMANGLNVSSYADNLVGQLHVQFPGTKGLNSWIFNRVFRGAMIQASHANYLRNLSRFPELTKREVARRTAKEMNEVFGNMMSQGILKDKTIRDITQLTFLAPQWVESQARAEFRGYGQMGMIIPDALMGKFRVGTVAQGQATAVAAYLIGNQIINYATTGHSTFENDENKLSAFLPIGDRGVYLNPLALSAEYVDRVVEKMGKDGGNLMDAMAEIGRSKLSRTAQSVVTLVSGRDWRNRRLEGADRFIQAGKEILPVPIGASSIGGSLFSSDPNATLGFSFDPQYDKITQGVLQAMGQRGVLGSGGAQYPNAPLRVPSQRAVRGGRQKRGVY